MAHHLSSLLRAFIFSLIISGALANGSSSGMQAAELSALFEVVGSLLADQTWAQFHPHPCTDTPWPGVQCELINPNGGPQQDPFLHVTKLHIGPDLSSGPPCKPTAHLPPSSLVNLPYLKSLSLFYCFLLPSSNFSLSPSLFTNHSSLEQLVLKSNPGLSGEIPRTLSTLRNLRVLSLSQNNLQGEIPEEICGLDKLQQLDLSYNNLTGEIPSGVGGLASLTILDLSWNKLRGQIPRSAGQLSSLQKLDLSSNSLSSTIPADLGKLQKLVLIDLSHNSVTGPMPETLSGLKELEYFLIENNPIGTGIPLFLGSLKKLSIVALSGCGLLGPIPAACFESLQNLTALALDRNRLNGSVPSSLGSLPRLGQLNLSQNQLSGEIEFEQDFVSRLGNRLDVRDNRGLCTSSRRQTLLLPFKPPPCDLGSSASADANGGGWGKERERPRPQQSSGCLERLVSLRSLSVAAFVTLVLSMTQVCFA